MSLGSICYITQTNRTTRLLLSLKFNYVYVTAQRKWHKQMKTKITDSLAICSEVDNWQSSHQCQKHSETKDRVFKLCALTFSESTWIIDLIGIRFNVSELLCLSISEAILLLLTFTFCTHLLILTFSSDRHSRYVYWNKHITFFIGSVGKKMLGIPDGMRKWKCSLTFGIYFGHVGPKLQFVVYYTAPQKLSFLYDNQTTFLFTLNDVCACVLLSVLLQHLVRKGP